MSDKKMRDEMFDAMIAVAGKAYMSCELEKLPSDDEIDYQFSKQFESRMKKIRRKESHKPIVRNVVRLIAVTMAILSVMLVTAFAYIPEFQEKVMQVLILWTQESTDFQVSNTDESSGRVYRSKYLPEGFSETNFIDIEPIYNVWYENGEGNRIVLIQMPISSGNLLSIDNEKSDYSVVESGDNAGQLFKSTNEGLPSYLVFNYGEYLICLQGNVDESLLIDMFRSYFEN